MMMNRELMRLERKVRRAEWFWAMVYRIIVGIACVVLAFVIISIIDMYRFTAKGINTFEYHDFESLIAINPEVVAWITMDGTNINHPVVQADDNFKYLDVDFYGDSYAGGTIFLDAGNSRELSDSYNIIHGHHMAGGAMFGDLAKYRNEKCWKENMTGTLLNGDSRYKLTVAGVGTFDAYDMKVYAAGRDREIPLELIDLCSRRRSLEFKNGDQLVALSTCSGDMSNNRIVVFCRMRRDEPDD